MVSARLPANSVDTSILGEKLTFPNGRIAKNRFLKASMTEKLSSWELDSRKKGIPTEAVINMYEKWGHGDWGMILSGNVIVDENHPESFGNILITKENDNEELREQLRRLAKAMKADGSLGVLQISHGGRQTPALLNTAPYSSSDVQLKPNPIGHFGKPIPIPKEKIQEEVIDKFVHAAKVAYECGFDGVQLHGAHGYLLSQFMDPNINKRTDKYGGGPERRFALIWEIYNAIRKEIPKKSGFLVGIKFNSFDFQNDDLSLEGAKVMCNSIEANGFDFIELSGGNYERLQFHHVRESTIKREAFFLEFSDALRSVFKNTVVYVTGGFRTAAGMVNAVAEGSTQGIGIGRPATAEPDLPKKILRGEAVSAVADKFDQSNFGLTLMAANSQMASMGKRSLKEADGRVTADIPDFSRAEEAEKFQKDLGEFMGQLIQLAETNVASRAVLEYIPVFEY